MREVLKCDPYDPLTAASFPKAAGGRPVQDSFQDHQSQLDVGDVCNLFSLQFILQFVRAEEDRKRSHFCQDCTGLFFVCSRCQTIQLPASSKQ